jgi:hypothetical protein
MTLESDTKDLERTKQNSTQFDKLRSKVPYVSGFLFFVSHCIQDLIFNDCRYPIGIT